MKFVNVWMTAVVALALGGCGDSPKTATTADATTQPTAATGIGAGTDRATPAATTTSSTPKPVLPDGRSPAYLTGLSTGKNTVSFDLIEFLTGDAAKAAWKKEHPENPDGPDDDYLIVNNNTKLRTLPVSAGATCVVLATLGGTDTKTIAFDALPAYLDQQNKAVKLAAPHIAALPFWLTVEDGTVTALEEQFLP